MLDDPTMDDLTLTRGCYKYPATEPRDFVLRLRLTRHEYERIAKRAATVGCPVATLGRALMLALAPPPE